MNGISDKQMRFCALVAGGMAAGRAYEQAGYSAKSDTADQAASRLLRNVKVAAYLEELRKELREKEVMGLEELKMFLAGAIRTPLSRITPDNPLCHKYTRVEKGGKAAEGGEEQIELGLEGIEDGATVVKVEKVDPLRAAALLIGINGWNQPQEIKGEFEVTVTIGGDA